MSVLKLDLKKELTLAELKHLFSHTHEYSVEQTKPSTFKITFDGNSEKLDTLIYKPTLQTLLRQIHSLSYLDGYQDAKKPR